MNPSFRTLNYLLGSLSLLLLLLSLLFPTWPPALEWSLFIGLMLLTGIPHGAADHLVFQAVQETETSLAYWLRFLGQYLGLMLLYGLLWWWLPGLSLALFLGLSFYHFGQSELFFLPLPEKSIFKQSLYLSWGSLIMLSILYWHLGESLQWLEGLLAEKWLDESMWASVLPIVLIGSGAWTVLGLLWVACRKKAVRPDLWLEMGLSLLLLLLCRYSSLLVSFAIYFGLWHAGKAIWMELQAFRELRPRFGIKAWIQAALPFSLISLFGIGLLLWAAQWEGLPLHPGLLFFIAVSTLTLPHMMFLGALYRKRR